MADQQDTQPIVEILERIARELDDACVSVDDLHLLVDAAFSRLGDHDPAALRSAQNVDILHQKIACLSHFVQELAKLMPSHWVVESHAAAQQLRLARLKERLAHPHGGPAPSYELSSGDFEIL